MKHGQEIVAKYPGIIIIYQKISGKKKGRHHHDDHEVFIPLEGEIGIEIEGETLKAGKGNMIYIPPGIEHSFSSSVHGEGERLYFFVSQKMWEKFKGINSSPKVLPVSQLSKELLFYLITYPNTKSASSLCQTLVEVFSEMLQQAIPAKFDLLSSNIQDLRIKKVWEKMAASYSLPLPMDQLAQSCGLSVRNLNRRFREESGMTPKQAITYYRIEKAK